MPQPRTIDVVPYQIAWNVAFETLAGEVAATLDDQIVDIHHIGSTAVPGLCAKPIIDLLPVVQSIEAVDALKASLEAQGYEGRGEYGLSGRRYFIRWQEKQRIAHVHIYAAGHSAIRRHLAFRDYLRAHASISDAYGRLKVASARTHRHAPEAYSAAKADFIQDIEQRALAWAAGHTNSA
ncbi:MAG: GrpB family protein [Bacteroidota bacterium]